MSAPEPSARRPATLDHLVYAVPDLLDGVQAIATLTGVDPTPGGRHVGRGTANYLLNLGHGAYLEVIGPDPDPVDAPPHLPFGIERLEAPALVTWASRTRDIDGAVARSRVAGYDPGDVTDMSRRTDSGDLLAWRLTPDTISERGGLIPFLIDWGTSPHPTTDLRPELELTELSAAGRDLNLIRLPLRALGIQLSVADGPVSGLRAVLVTPRGEVALR